MSRKVHNDFQSYFTTFLVKRNAVVVSERIALKRWILQNNEMEQKVQN